MGFSKRSTGLRPSTAWNEPFRPDNVSFSPVHEHSDFVPGYDMYYTAHGKPVGKMDGLKPEEADLLALKYGKKL